MKNIPQDPILSADSRHRLRRSVPILPLACALLGGVLPASPAVAQSTEARQESGVITGRVANAGTGQYLANAVVMVNGGEFETRTADDGYFRISGLKPGTYRVTAAYTGLDAATQNVVVSGGTDQTVEFSLNSEIYILGEFIVSSDREGSARAIQEQRESTSIKSIIAADSFGNMVDGNIGELMKNLPGVTIDYAGGEDAAQMRIRGMDPSLASITMDGNPFATNPGSDTRSFSLRDLAVQNIEAIEIHFAPTPAQPSNSMGGSVNFKTKTAHNQKGRRIRLDANLSLNSAELQFQKTPGGARTPDRKLMPGFTLSYSEAFGTERPLGVSFVASFAQRYRFNNSYRPGYSYHQSEIEANNGVATPETGGTIPNIFWDERGQADERRFVNLNLDYRLSDSTTLFLFNSVTADRGLGDYRHGLTIRSGTQTADASFNRMVSPAGTTINPTVAVSNNNTRGFSVNPRVQHRFGDFELNYDVYLSRSKYAPDQDRNYSVSYNVAPGTGLIVDQVSGAATGVVTQTAGADYLDIANYQSLSLYQDYTSGEDEQMGGKIDAAYSTRLLNMPVKFQAGAHYNEQSRENKRYYRKWDLTGNSGSGLFGTSAEPNLQQFADPYFGDQWGFDVPIANWISPYYVYDYFVANPNQFYNNYVDGLREQNRNQFIQGSFSREKYGDRDTKEQIYAGYGMATINVLPNLTVIAGARYEYTKLTARGVLYDAQNTRMFEAGAPFDAVTPTSPYFGLSDVELAELLYTTRIGTKSYEKLFPNLQAKYEPIKNLIIRGAVTTNMGRPDFRTVMPGDTIYNHYNLIRRNNTELLPQEGTNIDLNIEYYLPRSGLVSLTLFKQKIENYINPVITSTMILNPETGLDEPWTVETSENVGRGSNEGVTFMYRQKLGFIAHALRDFEFYTTFTLADPKAEYLRRTGAAVYVDPPTPGTPEYDQWLADVDAYMNSPQEWTTIPLAHVIEKSANVRLAYNGRRFSGSVSGFWRDDFARSVQLVTLDHTMQKSDLRWDLQLTYKISSRWSVNFDWRNFTDEADDRRIFDRSGGFYTSGMVMNLGLRANF